MRTFRVFVVSLIVLFAVGSITISRNNAIGEEKENEKVILKIEGMATPCCIPKVEEALLKVKGVKKVSVCIKRGIAEVEMETGQVTIEQLIKAVKEAGFKASVEEMEKRGAVSQLESKFEELGMTYNIVKEKLVEHWNSVEDAAKKIYEACCKWSLSRGMEIKDAEDYCKSAMLSGMGEQSLAEERFKPIESEYRELSKRYNIPKMDLEKHWNFVKEATKKSYEIGHKWALSRNMKIEDAKGYCKSAILSGMGEAALAEQIFKKEVRKLTDYEIKDLTKDRYGRFAGKYAEKGNPCPIRKKQVRGLYSEEEISLVSKTAHNLALGCGNPVSFANLKPGEVAVDLGCGAGIDVILAAHKVGPTGRIIGVDIAPQMIEKAKQAVADAGLQDRKIELYLGDIEKLQLPDSFADVVISNCVIILVPNKDLAYREAFRILKPGGRIAISDIVFSEKISPKIKERFQSTWAGILGGAIEEKDYLEIVTEAGFRQIEIVKRYFLTPEEVMAMSTCPGTEFTPATDEKDVEAVQGKVVSIKFTAIKP